MFDLSTDSATITSRAVPRTPLAKRSQKRIPRICHHEETSASSGFTALATKYPPTTMGLRCETLSARYPEKSLAKEATLSAMPSMIPSCAGPAPSDARKAGSTQYAISLAVSLRNEVRPKAYILRGVDRESGGGGVSMSVHENSMGTEANGAGG